MKFGLSDRTYQLLNQCLAENGAIQEAILYGSRAKGNYKPGSDIDLTLKGDQLTLKDVFHLQRQLDDLLLPYKIDISIYGQLSNPDLLDHIKRVGIVFYQRGVAVN